MVIISVTIRTVRFSDVNQKIFRIFRISRIFRIINASHTKDIEKSKQNVVTQTSVFFVTFVCGALFIEPLKKNLSKLLLTKEKTC
jgi:hypothetical protein